MYVSMYVELDTRNASMRPQKFEPFFDYSFSDRSLDWRFEGHEHETAGDQIRDVKDDVE